MCPISTALPAPLVTVADSHIFAVHDIAAVPGTASLYQNNLKVRNETAPAGEAATLYGGIGGVGSTAEVQADSGGAPGNVFCTLVTTTVNSIGGGFMPAFARPSWGPASAWAPGAITGPGNVVGVYNISWALTTAADAWPIDTTGFTWIIDRAGAGVNFVNSLRTGSAPRNGFGFFFNSDGAGAAVVEYVAWDLGAAVERIRATAAMVPDVQVWNSFRFVIISAAAGREATLDVSVNGFALGTQKVFGSAALPFPTEVFADSLGYVTGFSASVGGGEGFFYNQSGYDGRFTPEGVEVQPFGA